MSQEQPGGDHPACDLPWLLSSDEDKATAFSDAGEDRLYNVHK